MSTPPASSHPAPPRIAFCARSHVGRVRMRNEDTLEVCEDQAWALLADGMGGYRGGDVASRIAVTTAMQRLQREAAAGRTALPDPLVAALTHAACDANDEIRREAMKNGELAGMGSTLVMAAFLADCVVSVHVGDSRLYRLSGDRLQRLTRDHTMLQELLDGGMMSAEEAARSKFRGMLTRGLGVAATVTPDAGTHAARPGDIFLLCSDGLTDMLDDEGIKTVLAAVTAADDSLSAAADRLVELANGNGGRDNISVILARMAA